MGDMWVLEILNAIMYFLFVQMFNVTCFFPNGWWMLFSLFAGQKLVKNWGKKWDANKYWHWTFYNLTSGSRGYFFIQLVAAVGIFPHNNWWQQWVFFPHNNWWQPWVFFFITTGGSRGYFVKQLTGNSCRYLSVITTGGSCGYIFETTGGSCGYFFPNNWWQPWVFFFITTGGSRGYFVKQLTGNSCRYLSVITTGGSCGYIFETTGGSCGYFFLTTGGSHGYFSYYWWQLWVIFS